MSHRIVIVGASLAGASAAITLRDEGFAGQVTPIGAEPHPAAESAKLRSLIPRG